MTDNTQGDPRLFLDENGSYLLFNGGQPIMDKGLENLALISLFTLPGWFGNALFDDVNQHIGSNFMPSTEQPITLSTLNVIADASKKALNDEAFGEIDATVTNPESYRLEVVNTIHPPGKDIDELIITKNGLNWVFQKEDPAYIKE